MFTSVSILGKPNVGKSTLFNKLTRSRKAIVSDFSGLTKDRNYGYINFQENYCLLIDTGGIQKEAESNNKDISEQAWIAAEESNLVIFLLDGSQDLSSEDLDILKKIRKLDKPFITVLNKLDKKSKNNLKNDLNEKGIDDFFEISAEHSKNLPLLKSYIQKFLPLKTKPVEDGKKIAVLGRPNSGKSTFINKFIKEDRLIVSEIAGTTIDSISIPFIAGGKEFVFIDTAGIRKKYKKSGKIEYFSFIRAMHSASESDIVLFICDANEGLVDQDLKIINMVSEIGKPIVIAFNKIDLLSKNKIKELLDSREVKSKLVENYLCLTMSGKNKIGFKKLFYSINRVLIKSQKKYSTSLLNKLLEKFTQLSAPPSVSGRQLKLKHAHFAGINPTTIIISSNQDKKIPQNYKKYIKNSYKSSLNLESIQLNVIFRKSDNPFKNKSNELTKRQIKKRQRLKKFTNKNKK